MKICEAINIIMEITRPKKGGLTAYNAYHIIKSLSLMRGGPVGRPNLEKVLNIGEASVKTLLKRLREENLIIKGTFGHVLSERGRKLIELVEDFIKVIGIKEFPGIGKGYIILVKDIEPPHDLIRVYKIRDYVVSSGCLSNIVIGGLEEGIPTFPGVPEYLANKISELIERERLRFVNRGVIIAVPSDCLAQAYSASLQLLKELCHN